MARHPSPLPPDPAWPPARKAHLRRKVIQKMRKFRNSKELALLEAKTKEKAPGLAAEDFPLFVEERGT